ncbi:hypothetical protein HD601_002902 [Jiangella mangrovi]|uniref:Uncharacterized protein n=1 Tax=Jiangella mangrovi TaxID=1524084 RepID=A0A7W9GQT8_9ACTN|nr:hypothetical protein [Jiangella mangrovi]
MADLPTGPRRNGAALLRDRCGIAAGFVWHNCRPNDSYATRIRQ